MMHSRYNEDAPFFPSLKWGEGWSSFFNPFCPRSILDRIKWEIEAPLPPTQWCTRATTKTRHFFPSSKWGRGGLNIHFVQDCSLRDNLDCSQSPIFPWDRRCRSLRLTGRHLGLLMRATLGRVQKNLPRILRLLHVSKNPKVKWGNWNRVI